MRAAIAGRHAAVLLIAGAAVALRLPFLLAPEGADEGGYLVVARQWHGAGPSLYGHYWVDRPPLLITLFQLAAALGGLPALRVVGALAAGVAVLGVAAACRHVAGHRAAVWGAAVAAAAFASPQLGTIQVNGELLAAPFVAWSIALSCRALAPSPGRTSGAAAFGTGALAVAALLVKQNMAEPLVFAGVATLVAWRIGFVRRRDVRNLVGAAAAGAATMLLVMGGWTMLHGTSITGVFDAMYPFRIRAAHLLATLPDQGQTRRSGVLLHTWLTSGLLLAVAAFAWAVVRRRVRGPVVWGLSATLVVASASVVLSGGFWDHYLVELIVPVAMAAGLAFGREGVEGGRRSDVVLPSLAAGIVVVVALAHWVGGLGDSMSQRGVPAGTAIAAAAAPGDTILSIFGDAETVDASGLQSPYPYLWTLPAQVDDPDLTRLRALLAGPDAPTWIVAWNRSSFPTAVGRRLDAVVAAHYRVVGEVCGNPVLLHNGVDRPALTSRPCHGRLAAVLPW